MVVVIRFQGARLFLPALSWQKQPGPAQNILFLQWYRVASRSFRSGRTPKIKKSRFLIFGVPDSKTLEGLGQIPGSRDLGTF